jgi:hypothetical protein
LRPDSPAARNASSSISSSASALGTPPSNSARTRSKMVAAAFAESCWPTIARSRVV